MAAGRGGGGNVGAGNGVVRGSYYGGGDGDITSGRPFKIGALEIVGH